MSAPSEATTKPVITAATAEDIPELVALLNGGYAESVRQVDEARKERDVVMRVAADAADSIAARKAVMVSRSAAFSRLNVSTG